MAFVFSASTLEAADKALEGEGKALLKAADLIEKERARANLVFQRAVDEMSLAFAADIGKSKAAFVGKTKATNSVRAALAALADKGVDKGVYKTEMAASIAFSMVVAFLANIPFSRDLKNTHKADGTPRASKRDDAEGAATSGAVSTTTPEAAEKTARKLIGQLRMLGNDAQASSVIDVMLEFNPAFTE